MFILVACSDVENEENLVNLHTAANQDIISINFPSDKNESILSISSEFNFVLQGVKSNNIDTVTLSNDVVWSLSANSLSKIDQTGHFTASDTAELITLSAQFGHLTEYFAIKVSDAKFDKVINLNKQTFNINMCQAQVLTPIGRYVDNDGIEEIRPVDNIIINSIDWTILNQEDSSSSQRAHIKTLNNQANLQALAAGNLIIQAKAFSAFSGSEVTSDDFIQSVDNNLYSIKICNFSDTDLSVCSITEINIEQDTTQSLISVATYQSTDGSYLNQNISQNSKWGIDNSNNAKIEFTSDLQNITLTGLIEETTANLFVACGEITQSISSIDITNGVILNSAVSCDGAINCNDTSSTIDIDLLTVDSITVTANNENIDDDVTTTFSSRPAEITLKVIANYSNGTSKNITDSTSSGIIYTIISGENIIEEKTNNPGIYTVIRDGSAKIQLSYRTNVTSTSTDNFIVSLDIP